MEDPRQDGGEVASPSGAGFPHAGAWAWLGFAALFALFAWNFFTGPGGSLVVALVGLAVSSALFLVLWRGSPMSEWRPVLQPVAASGNLFLSFVVFVVAARLVPGLDDLGGGLLAAFFLVLTFAFLVVQAAVLFFRRNRSELPEWLRDLFVSTAAWQVLMVVLLWASFR